MSDITPQDQDLNFHKNVSPEERKEILESIDKMVTDNKLVVPKAGIALEAAKKGFVFPLTINILAILAVGASFFLSDRLFQQRQENIAQETQFYLSAEGKLLEELKKESEQKLQAKDQEIGRIQDELADLDRKSAELAATMESTIQAKEETLRREMEAALEEERQRLSGAGSSEEEIQARLRELQNQIATQNNQAIERFRLESEEALAAQRRELEQTIALNKTLLDQANEEKLRLQSESLEREAELTSQFQEEKAVLEAQTRQARAQLESLSRVQEQQVLLQDQINGSYQSVMERVDRREYSEALAELRDLRNLLTSEAVQGLPAFARRQTVDLFLLDTLKEDVEDRIGRTGTDTAAIISAADRLMAAEGLAQRGLNAYDGGDRETAKDYFEDALERLPLLAKGVGTLEEMARTDREAAMNAALTLGKTHLAEEKWNQAATQFRIAAARGGDASGELTAASLEGLDTAYKALVSQETSARQEETTRLQRTLDAERRRLEQENRNALAQAQREQESAVENLRIASQAALEEEQTLRSRAVSEMEIQLSQKESAVEELNDALSEKETELAQAVRRLSETAAEADTLTAEQNELKELSYSYGNLKVRLDRLIDTGLPEDAERAEALLTEFLKDEADLLFPDLGRLLQDTRQAAVTDETDKAEDTGYDAGKREALEDILLFTQYLTEGSSAGATETLAAIRTKTTQDSLYARAIRDIQVLADQGSSRLEEEGGLIISTQILGTVAQISGNRIIIESLISRELAVGTEISVRRKSRTRGEILVATGKITAASGTRIEAELNQNLTSSQVEITDLVYIAEE